MDGYQQADFVLAKVEQLVDSGAHYDDIAILYRAHYHAMELQVEHSRRGMPLRHNKWLAFFRAGSRQGSRRPDTICSQPQGPHGLSSLCLPVAKSW